MLLKTTFSRSALRFRVAPELRLPSVTPLCLSSTTTASSDPKKNAFGSSLPDVLAKAGWEGTWVHGVTPWDAKRSPPILEQLLKGEGPALPKEGKVLVPGAGSGYDAFSFAKGSPHFAVTGLDIAPTAVKRCKDLQAADAEVKDLPISRLRFLQGDFFNLGAGEEGTFDLLWDYTFMTALPPTMWEQWAAGVSKALKPGGQVVCLIFPVADFEGGPPFAVQPPQLVELLEKQQGMQKCYLEPVPKELSHKARAGREWLGIWKKSRA